MFVVVAVGLLLVLGECLAPALVSEGVRASVKGGFIINT